MVQDYLKYLKKTEIFKQIDISTSPKMFSQEQEGEIRCDVKMALKKPECNFIEIKEFLL
jgi:hypothetical protein